MVDVAAGFGIDQRHAGLTIEMAGIFGELVSEDLEDRGVDFNSADVLGAEKKAGKNVATAAHADDRDVGRRLHQVRGIDDVVLQIGELADIAVLLGDDRTCVRVDVEVVLVYLCLRLMDETPAERNGLSKGLYPHARIGIPALEQRARLLYSLGPEHTKMAAAGNIKPGMHRGHGRQRKRDSAAQAQVVYVIAIPYHHPTCTGGRCSDP